MTFYVFWNVTSKKRKNSCFFEIWKKRKILILEHWPRSVRRWRRISFHRFSDNDNTRHTDFIA